MKKALVILAMGFLPATAEANLVVSALNSPTTISFETTVFGVSNGAFAGAGFQAGPTDGQLDSDGWAATGWSNGNLAFSGTQTTANTDYTRGPSIGGVITGGIYAFTVATNDRALGIQPSDNDWAPGTLTLRIFNQTASTIHQLDIAYEIWVRNDQGRGNSFNFSYSSDGSSFTSVSALDLTSGAAADAPPAWVQNNRSTSIFGLNIANDAQFYLRWSGNDVLGEGSRDEFALDDISVTGITAVPEPETYAMMLAGLALLGFAARRRKPRALRRSVCR